MTATAKRRWPAPRLVTRRLFTSASGEGRWVCSDDEVAELEALVERADFIVSLASRGHVDSDGTIDGGVDVSAILAYQQLRNKFPT